MQMDGHTLWTTDLEIRRAYSEDASGLIAVPEAVARPTTEDEVEEIVRTCAARGVPLTAQGLRSSTVGGPLSERGVVLSCERLARVLDIDLERRIAIVEPGANLGDFKRMLRGTGFFYPPDPTSENECTVGGSVMANASGARTYKYGPTRPYVRGMRVVTGEGAVMDLTRSRSSKNTTGYFGFQDPIDLFVGSEGTLGIATRIVLDLVPAPRGFFSGMAFFPSIEGALSFVLVADAERRAGRLNPRCLELFDEGSLDLIRPEAGRLNIPGAARAAIFFEQECVPEEEEQPLASWLALLEGAGALADDTIVALSEDQQMELRRFRHALPEEMNERGVAARATGGRKLSTDWAVPLEAMPATVADASRIVEEVFGGYYIRYGHVGNGHPHFNLLARDPEELRRAREATHRLALLAVERGGTVTAEHGVGKVKREYLRYQYPAWVIEGMRAVKRVLDPHGILAPGNIFE
jgi:FAD/FMN-containing dehydrogenase